MTDSFDSPWKEIADRYLPQMMQLLFPRIHAEIDWARGYESLDTELNQVVRDADLGKRLADKLFRVHLSSGLGEILHLHIEVQGEREAGFAERLFVYHYRIFDYRGGPVVSVAILADDDPNWRRAPTRPSSSAAACASSTRASSCGITMSDGTSWKRARTRLPSW